MLDQNLKDEIQRAYRQILAERDLRPRYGQRLMVASIANALAGLERNAGESGDEHKESNENGSQIKGNVRSAIAPVCVVEAGTGTGKTLAYLLATLPIARHFNKKVVLATATIALQEQVINRDLPDILKHSGMDFSMALAKGRGRYVCLARLDQQLQGNESEQAMRELFGDLLETPGVNGDNTALYERMLERIASGEWQGDREDWPDQIRDDEWQPVTVEAGQCAGPRCSYYSRCCFYKARESMQTADCIVANHDLVLVDLALGGGAILPDPEDTIYIFDEAHHLPFKANQHFAEQMRVRGTLQWLEQMSRTLVKMAADPMLATNNAFARAVAELQSEQPALQSGLSEALLLIQSIVEARQGSGRDSDTNQGAATGAPGQEAWHFPSGVLPPELKSLADQLQRHSVAVSRCLRDCVSALRRQMEEGESLEHRQQAELCFPAVGGMNTRAESICRLWHSLAKDDPAGQAPTARWLRELNFNDERDYLICSSPVLASGTLTEHLWDRCAAAILTSATLSALGRFDMLAMRAGLPENTEYHRIASPFDYQQSAVLRVPKMQCDPSDSQAHTEAIAELLPRILNAEQASLMLFSSRRQMQDVLALMPTEWQDRILSQDDYQKQQLINLHRERIDRGEGSVIFGLASFAEGVDLPGKYCEHVIIAKIPFAVPNDPIEATLSQWLSDQGKNPFQVLSVPEAAFKLVQAAGRLLRNESDTGIITVLDERLVTRRYGKDILDSLPPYRRELMIDL